jgi:ABC-type branched-subunit amino acid transport system ATPase component
MLKSVRLKNFKLFKEADIPLERLTVFVGPNGSGKTTVLEAIYCVTQITHAKGKRPSDLLVGRLRPSQVKRRNAIEPTKFGCVAERAEESDFLEFELLELMTRDGVRHWDFAGRAKQGKCISSTLDEPLDGSAQLVEFSTPERLILSFSEKGQLLRLDAFQIAESSEIGKFPEVSENGRGVALILTAMAINQPEEYQKLQAAVGTVIPNFQRVRMRQTKVLRTENLVYKDGEKIVSQPVGREFEAYELILDMKSGRDLPGNCASEGTLLTIAILAVLMGPSQPKLLLLDDIDRGLHPRAMEQFVKILRELLEKDPELQIIATSHSPFLLNQLEYNEVRITSLDDEGLAHAALLSDHPDFERWKDVMSPGEFWSTVGESWAAGNGNPAHG